MADNYTEDRRDDRDERRGGGEPERARSRSPAARRSRSPERERAAPRPDTYSSHNQGNNLHVSGLSTRVEDRDLEEIFAKFGRIAKAQVMRDPHTKESRGFAFVTMEEVADAEAAMAGLNATELMGRVINVEKARRGRARTPTPGAYHGPPKPGDEGRRPAPYGRDSYGPPRGYDDRRPAYDDRRYDSRGGYDSRPPPPRDDYRRDDRYGGGGGREDYGRRDDRYGGGRY